MLRSASEPEDCRLGANISPQVWFKYCYTWCLLPLFFCVWFAFFTLSYCIFPLACYVHVILQTFWGYFHKTDRRKFKWMLYKFVSPLKIQIFWGDCKTVTQATLTLCLNLPTSSLAVKREHLHWPEWQNVMNDTWTLHASGSVEIKGELYFFAK